MNTLFIIFRLISLLAVEIVLKHDHLHVDAKFVKVMQPNINFSLLPDDHLQDSPHILACIVHLLAPQKEFNSVFPLLGLT